MDREKLVWLLTEIYDTASVPFKATGKFAYVAYASAEALVVLGEPDPRDRNFAESEDTARATPGEVAGA